MSTFVQIPMRMLGWQVEINQEQIEVTTLLPQPDPDWRFVDSLGHGHFYAKDGEHYPTLKIVEDAPGYVDADGEEYPPEEHWACRFCGEEVRPGTKGPSGERQFIPGSMDIHITDADGNEYRPTKGQWSEATTAAEFVLKEHLAPSWVAGPSKESK